MLCYNIDKQHELLQKIDDDTVLEYISDFLSLFHVRLDLPDEYKKKCKVFCPDRPTAFMYIIAIQNENLLDLLINHIYFNDKIDLLFPIDGFNILHIAAQGKSSIFTTILNLVHDDIERALPLHIPSDISSNTSSIFNILFSQERYYNLIMLLKKLTKEQIQKFDLLLMAIKNSSPLNLLHRIIFIFGSYTEEEVSSNFLEFIRNGSTSKKDLERLAMRQQQENFISFEQKDNNQSIIEGLPKPKIKKIEYSNDRNCCWKNDDSQCNVCSTIHACPYCKKNFCDLHIEIHINREHFKE